MFLTRFIIKDLHTFYDLLSIDPIVNSKKRTLAVMTTH